MTDFFIADTHFGHRNIINICSETRPFNTIQEHDETIISNWNLVVSSEDRVFVAGDFFLGNRNSTARIKEILSLLNGTKILIMGNHDLEFKAHEWISFGFSKVVPMLEYKGCLITHIPVDPGEIRNQSKRGRYIANIHGHLHEAGNSKEMNETGRFCISADQTGLSPVTWDNLWLYICGAGGKYTYLEDTDKCVSRLHYKTLFGLYNSRGKRIRKKEVTINPKIVYNLFSTKIDNGCILISEAGLDKAFIVKAKNFVGVL